MALGPVGARTRRRPSEIPLPSNPFPFFPCAGTVSGTHALLKLPYQIGIVSALLGGWLSLPLVFHYGAASKFNDHFVTCDPPDVGEADTWLEVGSWAWNWMEPPLGQISFVLLCLQFARAQMENMGMKPFTGAMIGRRAARVAEAFPQYNRRIIYEYSKSAQTQ